MKQPNVSIYGSKTCGDTMRAMQLLDGRQIQYEFKDLDLSPELNAYVADLNNGVRKVPVIQIDNEIMINPSGQELAAAVDHASAERP
jgi:glutaredoxin